MSNIYKHFYSLYTQEKAKVDRVIAGRQDAPSLSINLSVIAAALLGVGVSSLLLATPVPKQKLEDHRLCGITTGGQDECYFDCRVSPTPPHIVTNLKCLKDCFEAKDVRKRQQPVHCVNSLIDDVLKNGICLFPAFEVSGDPSEYPEYDGIGEIDSPQQFDGVVESTDCVFDDTGFEIITGTCSASTEELLIKQECIDEVSEQLGFISETIKQLIQSSCSNAVFSLYVDSQFDYEFGDIERPGNKPTRLAPAQSVSEQEDGRIIKTELKYTNTRHRYPWVCSLRNIGSAPEHLCAVTILSIPPKPTVLVGAAHCTYICKDEREAPVPSCCCSDGVEDCSDDMNKCGNTPEVFEMTGDDVQILCGEWETGDAPSELSEEEYNIAFDITEIIRHPKFNPKAGAGPIEGSDIAVFKIDDSPIQNKATSLRLWPICLPSSEKESPGNRTGIHAGWSKPPPFHFIEENASGYLRFYRDFFKQWHYKMDIMDKCRDPLLDGVYGNPLDFPSNSFYPAGTVCAKDFSRQSCFSTGDSGSPLMVREKTRPMRYYAEGISSFVKGCDVFTFGASIDEKQWQINQQSENPLTYTKLSCFLPWVAEQYDLEYQATGPADPGCTESQGDPEDGENTCRITPSNNIDLIVGEAECIFPFYYDGKKYEECVLFDESGFVYPVFRCPTSDIVTKINGTNSYPPIGLTDGLCPATDEPNSPLDPDRDDCLITRPVFSQCKNNCPGVRAFGIIGGGAALAFVGAAVGIQYLAAGGLGLGAIGAAGLGGNMLAQTACMPPYCTAISQQCCLLIFRLNGPECPDSC